MGKELLLRQISVDLAGVGDGESSEAVNLDVVLFFAFLDELLVLAGALELTGYGLEKLAHCCFILLFDLYFL